MNDDKNIQHLFKVRRTVLQMIRDRGYVVFDSKDDLNISRSNFEEFYMKNHAICRKSLEIKRPRWDNPENRILVVFVDGEKDKMNIGVKSIRLFCERIKNEGFSRVLMILNGKLTPHAKQAVSSINSNNDLIEYFSENELIVNITHHMLVPKHEILTKSESKSLLERYSIKFEHLPKILKNDPVAKYLGLQRSEIVKIIRVSETSGKFITYRICI